MLDKFKDIIPETLGKATESTPVKKVSETGAGARLVLSFGGMLVFAFLFLYVAIRWYPAKTYKELEHQYEVKVHQLLEEERYSDSLRNIRWEAKRKEATEMAREMFEEWKQNYIITQTNNTVTIKPAKDEK